MSDLCECGRYRGTGKHECYFVTLADWKRANDKRVNTLREPEMRYEPLVWRAWNMAIEEDAQREVDAEFPDIVDNLTF